MDLTEAEDRPVLRVLTGRLAGKEYGLSDRTIRIGHAIANDVVLRGTGTRDCAIDMMPMTGQGAAQLRIAEGEIECLGRVLTAGEELVLPPYLPFRLGEYWVAHGTQGSSRWQEAGETAALVRDPDAAPLERAGLADRLMEAGAREWQRVGKIGRGGQVMLWSLAAVLLLTATGPVDAIISQVGGSGGVTRGELRKAGFANVDVTRTPAGGFTIQGLVRDDKQLARLQEIVADRGAEVSIDVDTLPSIAASAGDILRTQGIEARVQPTGLAGVTVRAPYLPLGEQDRLRNLLRADLPALSAVAFEIDDAAGGNPLQRFFNSGGNALSAVVEGTDHIVTSDGTRWFEGSVLPTGHRLVKIQEGQVVLEKDGRAEQLNL